MEFPVFSFLFSLLTVMQGTDEKNRLRPRSKTTPTTVPPTATTTLSPQMRALLALCPEQGRSPEGEMFLYLNRYHNKTRACYQLLTQGPCGNNMDFYETDALFGECDCREQDRILIYHKSKKGDEECFPIFHQAYCRRGQWLDITRQGKPVCTRNPCWSTQAQANATSSIVEMRGACVEVGKPAAHCPADEVVGFDMNKRTPVCVPSRKFKEKAIGVPSTPCRPGSVLSLAGRCSPPFDFD